jgi:predicted DNA-binding transcriptional regulator AlpA
MEDRLLTRREVAEILGFQTATLARWAWKKEGPPFMKVGRKSVRYRASELRDWVLDRAQHRGENVEKLRGFIVSPPPRPG